MNLVLVLRAELVCLIILLYLTFVSRTYRMGKDVRIFNQILFFAIVHVVMDMVTVYTVNSLGDTLLNKIAHIIFYLSAIMYSYEMYIYTLNLSRPQQMDRKKRLLALLPTLIYLVLLFTPLLPIQYEQLNGTKASTGPAAMVGFVIAFMYFAVAIGSIFTHWRKVGRHFKRVMLPMLFLLIISELIQTQVKEFLFTGCAITAITVAFFFTLENPATVLERKVMMDALSGLGTRSGYEHDMAEYDREFEADKSIPFTFLFVDINNLRSVNGLYGHQEGDSYISNIAVLLMTGLRGAEHIYRMGGDEFLAIYRKTDEKVVVRDIKRVQDACAKSSEEHGYMPELAIGYAISDPKYNSLRDVLRVADYMMYRNKADIKRDIVEDTIRHTGTHLNLTGLTDRVFDAMCLTSEEYYPYITNMETNVTRVAPAMVEFFGLEGEFIDSFGEVWPKYVHPDDLAEYMNDLSATISGQKQYHFCRYRAKAKNGEYVELTCRGGVYHGRDGEPDVFAGYVVNHGATGTIDGATGLKNHQAMYELLTEALAEQRAGVVMRLEIRNLNRIRMIYSGETAASLIRNLASDFANAVDTEGEVYSNHGSNFIFCLPNYDEAKANELYRRIRKHCKAGILTDQEVIPVDITGGAVKMPDETLPVPSAIRQAALFAAEEAYNHDTNSLWFFGETDRGAGTYNKELLRRIQHDCIMDRTRFYLRFQPIIRAQTGEVAGAEALLRWRSEEHGEVSPGRFIAFLENDPAFEPLGYDIIRHAVRTAGKIRKTLPEFRINVNITAIQLLSDEFIPTVVKILEEEQFDPAFLMLELTERCKEMEFDLLSERVTELKKTGIRVALDDMGTGYSTIDLLLHLSADEFKLDMAFTRELRGNERHEILTRTLCASAARSKVDICFEGVETEETVGYLKGYGDVLLQGYYFAKPLMPEEFMVKYCNEK
ncbi:MAG: EAL domain-containing protein [Clostridia bacterium]|nr:EAL domain-containing protein [Clostridia bacterium]